MATLGLEQEAPQRIVHDAIQAPEVVGKKIIADDRFEGDRGYRKWRDGHCDRRCSAWGWAGHDRRS